jgi:hypothetical protein
MVFERPKSLFGKRPYYQEQVIIGFILDKIFRGAISIDARLVDIPIPTERLPLELRSSRARKYFTKAKEALADLGI